MLDAKAIGLNPELKYTYPGKARDKVLNKKGGHELKAVSGGNAHDGGKVIKVLVNPGIGQPCPSKILGLLKLVCVLPDKKPVATPEANEFTNPLQRNLMHSLVTVALNLIVVLSEPVGLFATPPPEIAFAPFPIRTTTRLATASKSPWSSPATSVFVPMFGPATTRIELGT